MPNTTGYTISAIDDLPPPTNKKSPTVENKQGINRSNKDRKTTLQTTEDKRMTITADGAISARKKETPKALQLQKTQERTIATPKVAKATPKAVNSSPDVKTKPKIDTKTKTTKEDGTGGTTPTPTTTEQTGGGETKPVVKEDKSTSPFSNVTADVVPQTPVAGVDVKTPGQSNRAQPTPPAKSGIQDASKSMPVMPPHQLLMSQAQPGLVNADITTTISDRSYYAIAQLPPEKKEDYVKEDPRRTIKQLSDYLFVREAVFPTKNRTLQSYTVDKYTKIEQSMLMGEFFNYDDNGYWRVLGMRPRRTVGPCIEYDVQRCKGKKTSRLEGTEHVMKLCDSDSPNDHLLFLQQYVFIKEFREAFVGHPQRYRFPDLLGIGAFDQLCYKDNNSDDDNGKMFILFPKPKPRPYFIVEKQGPTIEDLLHANQFGILDVSTARFLAIGMIQTLRVMHELGYVHRCVTNYTFGLRIKDGFLPDVEISLNVVCKDAAFVRKFRSINHPPRRVAPFAGTYKYCSTNAMENKEQMPNDDLVSVLYLFVEMVHGKLPWHATRNLHKIKQLKQQLQVEPPIVVDNTGEKKVAIDLRYLPRAFKLLETFNPFQREQYTTYRDVCTVLNLVAESNRHTLTETYVELDKLQDKK